MEQEEKITKTIRLEKSLVEKTEKPAKENERELSKQMKYMLKNILKL